MPEFKNPFGAMPKSGDERPAVPPPLLSKRVPAEELAAPSQESESAADDEAELTFDDDELELAEEEAQTEKMKELRTPEQQAKNFLLVLDTLTEVCQPWSDAQKYPRAYKTLSRKGADALRKAYSDFLAKNSGEAENVEGADVDFFKPEFYYNGFRNFDTPLHGCHVWLSQPALQVLDEYAAGLVRSMVPAMKLSEPEQFADDLPTYRHLVGIIRQRGGVIVADSTCSLNARRDFRPSRLDE